MKTHTKTLINVGLIIGLVAVILLLSVFAPASSMIFTVLKKGAIYSLVAVSMNLLNGFTGLFSLGQAGFMLIGAYTYAIFTIPNQFKSSIYMYFDGGIIHFTIPVIFAIILAGLAAAVFAYLIGLPVLRLKSDYLAIATLGFAEIIRAIFQWDKLGPITNASNMLRKFPTFDSIVSNISQKPRYSQLFKDAPWLQSFLSTMLPFLIAGVCIAIIVLLINSSYGRAFKSIRDDEVAAEAMGINLASHKMMAFCTSSFFAGISGALLAMYQTTIAASAFKSSMTYEILLIVVLGGIGSITGSCIGSFLFIASSEWWLRGLDSGKFLGIVAPGLFRNGFRLVVFSVIIMAVVLFYRKGIMGDKEFDIERIINRFRKSPNASKSLKDKKKGEVSGDE
jgi:branched-chain amino acid transport system permease protein